MLQHLHIENYAIIEELKIDFSSSLNIITGETGAGKSILMGALSLILGERADGNILFDNKKKCFVEGIFHTEHAAVSDFLKKNELADESNEIMIRREIAPNGKSRSFINDTPVTLQILKQFSSLLVDLHQQFDTLDLGDSDFQRQVIDALAGNSKLLTDYQTYYKKYVATNKELQELKQVESSSNREVDYKKFLLDELDEAGIKEEEIENVQEQLKVVENAEHIKATLGKVYGFLEEGEQPLVQQLKSLNNQLISVGAFHSDIPGLAGRIHSVQVELQDIADDLDRLNNGVNFDEEKITTLNDRISTGYKLFKKHGVSSSKELIEIHEGLRAQLEKVSNLTETIKTKEKECQQYLESALKIAEKISISRKQQVKPFQEKVDQLLNRIGMPNARIKVELNTTQELHAQGCDNIEFMFDANKSNRFEPLRKVASGGELSRLMLSIKSLVAKQVQLPTLIFDEIDTGISGEAAKQVGIIMKELATSHQLIAITHQPQIAAKAAAHYFIYKELKKDRILTCIKLLSTEERVVTIATMLSGEKPTPAAFENAREMIAG